MWTDIFIENNQHLLKTVDNFIKDLKKFRLLIKNKEVKKNI